MVNLDYKQVADVKAGTLENIRPIVFRFIAFKEFEVSIKRGYFDGEVNLRFISFQSFKNLSVHEWQDKAQQYTDWRESTEAIGNYKILEAVYIIYLKKWKEKEKALQHFQNWCKGYINILVNKNNFGRIPKGHYEFYLKYISPLKRETFSKGEVEEFPPLKKEEEDAILAELNYWHGEERKNWFENGKYDVFRATIEKQDYFIINQDHIKEIIQILSAPPLEYGVSAPAAPYEILVFGPQNCCRRLSTWADKDGGGWGIFSNAILKNIIGIQVLLQSSEFLEKIKAIVLTEAIKEPQNNIPIYNWRGTRVQ